MLKGEVCGRCSTYVEGGNAFCTRCGTSLGREPAPSLLAGLVVRADGSHDGEWSGETCPSCSRPVGAGSTYCGACGACVDPVLAGTAAGAETVPALAVGAAAFGAEGSLRPPQWPPRVSPESQGDETPTRNTPVPLPAKPLGPEVETRMTAPPGNGKPAAPTLAKAAPAGKPRVSPRALRIARRLLVAAVTLLIVLPFVLFAVWHEADKRITNERNMRQRDIATLNGQIETLRQKIAALEAARKK